MNAIAPTLTREEWRWLGLSALASVVGALASEGIRHGFEELRRVHAERRAEAKTKADESKAWRASLEAP